MSISGCSIHCPLPEINDIGLYGAILNNGKGEGRGFNLMAGGGLSTRPYFGKVMNAFVPFHQAEAVCLAILELFRDRGYRESRKRARMKFLVDDLGADAFRAEIVKRLGSDLDPPAEAKFNPRTFRDHIGVLEQKQPGLFSLGFVTLSGRILPEDLEIAAEIAERFGSGELANSCMQNLLVCDVPEDRLAEAQNLASKAPTLTLDTNPLRAGLVVCTGLQFCNLAVTETKNRSAEILAHLEQEAVLDTPIKIAVSGCPNSCSQFQAADIGLRGGLTRVGGEPVEAYDISVGCEMGPEGEMGRLLKKAIPAPQVKEELAAMLKNYLKERQEGETYQQYARRVLLPA
jgi:sulfite reductase beta subunit-like hemoprotein